MTSFTEDSQDYSINALTRVVTEFADARDWQQFHDPKNLAMSLSAEVGELVSVLRWVGNNEADAAVAIGNRRDALRAEIGDVAICLLLLCARTKISLGEAVLEKTLYNEKKYPPDTSKGRAEPGMA